MVRQLKIDAAASFARGDVPEADLSAVQVRENDGAGPKAVMDAGNGEDSRSPE